MFHRRAANSHLLQVVAALVRKGNVQVVVVAQKHLQVLERSKHCQADMKVAFRPGGFHKGIDANWNYRNNGPAPDRRSFPKTVVAVLSQIWITAALLLGRAEAAWAFA